MKIKLFFVALSLFHVVSAQETEKIKLQVRVISSRDGMEIRNATVKVAYALTENSIALKTEKKNRYYEIVKGADVKVSAEASQYYTEEKRFETEHLYDQDILEVTLTPKPEETVAEIATAPAAEPAPFFIIVRDIVSGDKINAQVEITLPSGRKEQVVSGASYLPDEKGEYNFVFKKDGFGSYSQKHTTKLSTETQLIPVTFEVRSVTFSEHEYALIDAYTRQPVMKSQLFILDENKRPVETLYNSSKGTYMTYRINPEKTYTAEVKAEGYEPLTTLLSNSSRNISLELTPSDLEKVTVTVQDAYSLETLGIRQLKIYSSANTALPVQEQNGEYSALLNPRNTYGVQFETEGYAPFNQERRPEGNKLEIWIRKPVYPLALFIQNELTEEQKRQATATVSQINGTALSTSFDPAKNAFMLESDPDEILLIGITVPGFRPYTASNNRKQLAQFQLRVQLEPEAVTPPVVTETADTPPVTETAPPVVTPPVVNPAAVVAEEKTALKEPALKEDVPMEAKKGRRYALNGVNFEQSQTTMLKGSEIKLREVLQFLTDNPRVSIEVIGHTDKTGDERQNQRLSEFRARAVANWLFNQGIDPKRIQTSGKGSLEPVADNGTEAGKAQNRRIEIVVVEE